MDDYFSTGFGDEYNDEEYSYEDDFAPSDPFDGFTRSEQDIFFRLLDLLPRELLEPAMDYFMARPTKMRALVDYAKQKRDLIKNGDTEVLNELFERESIMIDDLRKRAEEMEAELYGGSSQTNEDESLKEEGDPFTDAAEESDYSDDPDIGGLSL